MIRYGSGKYTVSLYHQFCGSKYQKDGEISFTVKMKDKLGYTLYPNQWVNYTAETAAVQYADELCANFTDEYDTFCIDALPAKTIAAENSSWNNT